LNRTGFNIILFFLTSLLGLGQLNAQRVRTIVPQRAVVVGEPFQLQFVLEDAGHEHHFRPPDLSAFRIVSGPNSYKGSMVDGSGQPRDYENITYTLIAARSGKVRLGKAVLLQQDQEIHSNETLLNVLTAVEAKQQKHPSTSAYYLASGEDPYQKIRENLLLRVSLDRNSCYVGEPLVATFKLYSRLQSKSDVVKNPGFYGFSVVDMINLDDNVQSQEMVNGKMFDVHVIRKAQLYPLQSGEFTIDPMELVNRVEFSRSQVNKKTEQEIVEGIFGLQDNQQVPEHAEVYETSIRSNPVKVEVKPLPAGAASDDSVGSAVGQFRINSHISTDSLARGDEGKFELKLSGSGNFLQLYAPSIVWPDGLEGFAPTISDSIEKSAIPLTGERTFSYQFIANREGKMLIPAVAVRYFNPKTKEWITDTSASQPVLITPAKDKKILAEAKEIVHDPVGLWIGILLGLIIISSVLFVFLRKKKMMIRQMEADQEKINQQASFSQLLDPLSRLDIEDPAFYRKAQTITWQYLQERFEVNAATKNTRSIFAAMQRRRIDENTQLWLKSLLTELETTVFTGVAIKPAADLRAGLVDCLADIEHQLKDH